MGGRFRPVLMALSALALLGIASPVAVLAGPLAAHQVAAATADAKPRAGQPAERADHASASSRGLHLGAGNDLDEGAGASPATMAPSSTASSGTPSAGTQAASTPAVAAASTNHSGGTSPPPPVIVEPPTAPQPNPPIAAQPALTGARLEWILVGVVTALAAAVVAAVRLATLRGRRPPR